MLFVWQLVEAGVQEVASRELASRLDAGELSALRAARVLRRAAPASAWDCDDKTARCFREVRPNVPRAPCPFLAVCSGEREDAEERCEPRELAAADVEQEAIAKDALVLWLRAAHGIDRGAGVSADDREPLRLGLQGGGSAAAPREVFFVVRPVARTLPAFVALRERAARPSLVVVPTAARVPGDLLARCGPGAHVEISSLDDAVRARQGRLAWAPKLRSVSTIAARDEEKREAPPRAKKRARALRRAPVVLSGASSWGEIAFYELDGHTLRIDVGSHTYRCTYVDLGLADGRTGAPNQSWQVLLAIVRGDGRFHWKELGEWGAMKTAIARLRVKLCERFALAENPFHDYEQGWGWRPKFKARAVPPGEPAVREEEESEAAAEMRGLTVPPRKRRD